MQINKQLATEFRQAFNANLQNYWHPRFGFDLLRFEKHFAPENLSVEADGKSMGTILSEKYGLDASRLIERIITES